MSEDQRVWAWRHPRHQADFTQALLQEVVELLVLLEHVRLACVTPGRILVHHPAVALVAEIAFHTSEHVLDCAPIWVALRDGPLDKKGVGSGILDATANVDADALLGCDARITARNARGLRRRPTVGSLPSFASPVVDKPRLGVCVAAMAG